MKKKKFKSALLLQYIIFLATAIFIFLRVAYLAHSNNVIDADEKQIELQLVQPDTEINSISKQEISGGNNNDSVTNFYRNSDAFLKNLLSCIRDTHCTILYHHIGKTGGTFIEGNFFHLFPPTKDGSEEKMKDSCCEDKVMARFNENPEKYCDSKFLSFQVNYSDMEKIVSECVKRKSDGRFIVLVSFRDPAARTLSFINQICNKNLHLRTKHEKEACKICKYENNRPFYNHFVDITYNDYRGIIEDTKLPSKYNNVKVLLFEMEDIDSILDLLQNEPDINLNTEKVHHNRADRSNCNFGMKTRLYKLLKPTLRIYRNIHYEIYQ